MKSIMFLLLILACMPVDAEVYKWVDKDGNVHFGDQPIEPVEISKVELSKGNNSYTSTGSNKWQQDYQEKQKLKKVNNEKQEMDEVKRQQTCDNYQKNLHTLTKVGRIVSMTPDGKRSYISDEERAKKTKEIKKKIKKHC